MTLATKSVTFVKVDQFSIIKPQLITVSCIMTVETPSHRFGVMKLDIRVFFFQFPLLSIHFHSGMAIAAREHSLGHWGRSDRELFACPIFKGRKTDP
jgi:hypothetical protein